MKTTNHLTPTTFSEFLDWLVREEEHLSVCPAKPDVEDRSYELSKEVVA